MLSRILAAISAFVAPILRELLPGIIEELRKPKKVLLVGDKRTKNAVKENTQESLSRTSTDRLRKQELIVDRMTLEAISRNDYEALLIGVNKRGDPIEVYVDSSIYELKPGVRVTILDCHVVYVHPVTRLETAVHRVF